MDKQKQIEEMAKVIEQAMAKARRILGGHNNIAMFYATMLINEGYRKITEGAVVINKDENPCLSCPVPEDIQRDVDCSTICGAVRLGIDWQNQCKVLVKENKKLTKELKQARKETAEKFAERLKAKLDEWLKDNEDNDGKIDFGIAEIELIGVESLEGEVIVESLIDEIAEGISEGK